MKTTAFGGGRAVEQHAKGFATSKVDDGAGCRTTTRASGDGALRCQKLEFVKSRHFLLRCVVSLPRKLGGLRERESDRKNRK